MKKNYTFCLATIFSLFFIGSATLKPANSYSQGYEIKVNIKGLADTTLMLGYHYGDMQYLKDTVEVDSRGNAIFKGDSLLDRGIYLIVLPEKTWFEIVIDQDQRFSIETEQNKFVEKMKVTGEKGNAAFYEYLQYLNQTRKTADEIRFKSKEQSTSKADSLKYVEELKQIDEKVKAYQNKFITDNKGMLVSKLIQAAQEPHVPPTPDTVKAENEKMWRYLYYKDHYFDNVDFTDDAMVRTPILHNKVIYYLDKLTIQDPDSIIRSVEDVIALSREHQEVFKYFVITIINKYATSKVMGHDAVYVHMGENYYLTKQAYWADSAVVAKIRERVLKIKPNMLGLKAPDLQMQDMYRKPRSLYEVDADYTVLSFWAWDCGHCKKEIPQLHDLYRHYKDQGVSIEVFAVSSKQEEKEWLEFIAEKEIHDWINVWDPGNKTNYRLLYDIYSTPVIFLLDKNKEIIAKRIDVKTLRKLINHELGIEEPEEEEVGSEEQE